MRGRTVAPMRRAAPPLAAPVDAPLAAPRWMRLPLGAAVLAAIGGGLLLTTAFAPLNAWIAAFPAIALVLVATIGRRIGGAVLVGAAFGLSFWLPHISWASEFLGPQPWSALSVFMTLWAMLGTVLVALAYRWVPIAWPGALGRLLWLPAIVAGLWTAREGVSSTWPYGGFSWGRVAFTQSDSPLTPLVGWVGSAGLTFLIVFVTAMAIEAVRMRAAAPASGRASTRRATATAGRSAPRRTAAGLAPAIGVAAVALLLVAMPAWPVDRQGSIRVGAVQGNPKSGYFDPPEFQGDILRAQLDATLPILGDDLDVIVWPEGASDLDPTRDRTAASVFDGLSERSGAPLIAGTITHRDGRYYNTSVQWDAGRGAVDFYDKHHPVPFGEYIPDRDFWHPFAPELIDLVQRDYTPGTTDAVMRVGDTTVGTSICFDIVDDQLVRDTVEEGAQVIFAQTNNADFGRTDESVQQLAIARMRAVETGRAVVNISTVGTSAVLLPDGRVTHEQPVYTPRAIVADVPLSTTITPAVLLGGGIELGVAGIGVLGLVAAFALTRRGMRR